MTAMRVAFATCSQMPDGWEDDWPAAELLGADFCVWDDPDVDWSAYDRVVLRSAWDYSWRPEQFLAWCRSVGPERLRNDPELVAFNSDKRYLAAIEAPVVPTAFVEVGDQAPRLAGEVVVKPHVSAGARDTGRFRSLDDAAPLIEQIHGSDRVALVQPYLPSVERVGETSLVFIAGEVSHVLNKRAVLRDTGVAPVGDTELRVAAVMLEDDLVVAGRADEAELALAREVHEEIAGRFGQPLYARVDLVRGLDGAPLVSELELIEPCLYMATAPGASERLADAVRGS